ncbi:MAG: hypothetical protein IPK34_04710 [Ramlibacter sp.]|nr:hypothetical protein [Ramlibacter sp.]
MRGLRARVAQIAAGKLAAPVGSRGGAVGGAGGGSQPRMAAILFAGMPMLGIHLLPALKHGHEGVSAAALRVTMVAAFATISLLLRFTSLV